MEDGGSQVCSFVIVLAIAIDGMRIEHEQEQG